MSTEPTSERRMKLSSDMERLLIDLAEDFSITHVFISLGRESVYPWPHVKLRTFRALKRRGLIEPMAHPSYATTVYGLSPAGLVVVGEIRAAVSAAPELAMRAEGSESE